MIKLIYTVILGSEEDGWSEGTLRAPSQGTLTNGEMGSRTSLPLWSLHNYLTGLQRWVVTVLSMLVPNIGTREWAKRRSRRRGLTVCTYC